jgi:mRNA-degrading endonuclease RelE of RelBE toxin-antitoxin system
MSNQYWLDIPEEVKGQVDRTPNRVRPRIKQEIIQLRDNPRPAQALRLRNDMERYRITIDDHHIYYRIHDEEQIIYVLKIGKNKGPKFYN